MSDAIKELHDYLAKSPSVVYPEDVLAYLPAIEAEFLELVKGAPNFNAMERDELVTYAYAMFAAGKKADSENAKLRELARGMYGILATFDAILGNHDACETPRPLIFGEDKSFKDIMRELGVEANG